VDFKEVDNQRQLKKAEDVAIRRTLGSRALMKIPFMAKQIIYIYIF
jgi:hypothetical protein